MGYVIPRFLLLVFLADAGLRLFPVEPFTFRAWEAMARYRAPGAAFEANRRYRNPRAYGDLAAMGNLPDLRQYREETFTTDPLGFRNDRDLRGSPLAAVLIGDSFAVGSGVNDDETLTARLSALLGCGVYNAGGIDPHPERILALARELSLERNLIVHEYNEDFEMPAVPSERRRRYQRAIAWMSPAFGPLLGRVRGLISVSPLSIACEKALKRLENGTFLPNPYASAVVRGTLRTGEAILFKASHVEMFHEKREAPTRYWIWLQKELRDVGLDLVVVLVPSKYRVYRRSLVDAGGAPEGGGDYLQRVEKELSQAGIPTLNLTSLLSTYAEEYLPQRVHLYWMDDLHWNRQAIELAAVAVHDGLGDRLQCPTVVYSKEFAW